MWQFLTTGLLGWIMLRTTSAVGPHGLREDFLVSPLIRQCEVSSDPRGLIGRICAAGLMVSEDFYSFSHYKSMGSIDPLWDLWDQ